MSHDDDPHIPVRFETLDPVSDERGLPRFPATEARVAARA
jgi:hypothetical protein